MRRYFEKAFDAANSPRGRQADNAYAKAASPGYWRTAARLISRALDDEDRESARPIAAWLLNRHVPAGYNKLADVLEAVSGYDGENACDAMRSATRATTR